MTPIVQRSLELLEARSDAQRKAIFAKMKRPGWSTYGVPLSGAKKELGFDPGAANRGSLNVFNVQGRDLTGLQTRNSSVRKKVAALIKKARKSPKRDPKDTSYHSSYGVALSTRSVKSKLGSADISFSTKKPLRNRQINVRLR